MKEIIIMSFVCCIFIAYFAGFTLLLLNDKPILGYAIVGLLILCGLHVKVD